MKKGKVARRKTCRLCTSKNLTQTLNLGYMPHAGDFLKKESVGKEKYYPLKIWLCNNCSHLQVLDVIKPKILFENYRYLSSIGLSNHFEEYAKEMKKRFLEKDSFVVEIGSNDGVLLAPLKKLGIDVLGVDPAKNIAKIAKKRGIPALVNYFSEKVAQKIIREKGQPDAVFANNVLAHIDNMDDVFRGIKLLLKPEGTLVFEVHYLRDLVSKLQYDFFYTEHLSYHSLTSIIPFLQKYEMEIFDVKKIPIHSGSIRVYVKFRKNKKYRVRKSVRRILGEEKKIGVHQEKYYQDFAEKVNMHRREIRKLIKSLKRKNERIVGYEASGRANTLLNFCKIGNNDIDYIVDESPERQGRYTPGTHIPIVNPEKFRKDDVKYALLFAWSYQEQILRKERKFLKKGGKFILPLPKVRIYP